MNKKKTKTSITPNRSEKPLISVCMIVKNEEKYIDQCLKSVRSIADEIVLVDTGSTDRTVEIARKYTDKIYFHPWNDSFSEARNHAMHYATGDWIFTIDADEELVEEDIPNVLDAVRNAGVDAVDAIVARVVSAAHKGRSQGVHNSERILRNNRVIHYEGRVHNRVIGVTSSRMYPIRILHHGYDPAAGDTDRKFERTVSLLKRDIEDDPNNPATHHYLSCSYLSRRMHHEAIAHGLAAIRLAEAGDNRDMMFLWTSYNISLAYYRLNDRKMARQVAAGTLKKYTDHIDSHFMLIVISFDEQCWKDLLYHAGRYLELIENLNTDPARFGNLMTCSLNEEWNIHVLTGIASAELGEEESSQRSFEMAIFRAPEPFIALRAIGIYLYNKNRTAEALSYLEKARDLNSNDEAVNDLLENILAKTGDNREEPTISCCMIVKNEEFFLEACLKSIREYVDEIIIVDTGSTDKTVEIAGRYTDMIFFHAWNNSFSEARNQAMSYATGDWILTIDADEELTAGSGELLRQAVRNAGLADAIYASVVSVYSGGKKTARHNSQRLLRNNGVIHYEGSVHNRVAGTTESVMSKIEIMHYGYNVAEKKANEKFLRTVELLKRQIRENPDDPRLHHYLGTSYVARGMFEEGIEESTLAVRLAENQGNEDALYLSTHYLAAFAFCHLGEFKNARDYSLRALEKHPDHLDSLYMMTLISAEWKQWNDVLNYGLCYLELREDYEKNPEKAGEILNSTIKEGHKVHLLVGHAFHALKDHASMDAHYLAADQTCEDGWQTWWRIGIYHLDHSGDLGLAKHYFELALEEAPDEPQVWYMLAKWSNKSKDVVEEKRCLSRLLELGGLDPMALNRLADLCISTDDLPTAEQALNCLLETDQNSHTVLCKLGLLRRRQNDLYSAMTAFGRAAEINPQDATPWLQLGEIAMQLKQLDNARSFFQRAVRLGNGTVKSLLCLCEVELRQERIADFVRWCDLVLKELGLNRQRTIDKVEDIFGILHEIDNAVTQDKSLSAQVSNLMSMLPSGRP